jgi:hypothetical protein
MDHIVLLQGQSHITYMVRKQGQSHERYIWCVNIASLMRDRYGAPTGTVSREVDMVR